MNLALPAPRVEEAVAPKVADVEPAVAELARPSHSLMNIAPPPIVEPATTDYDTTTNIIRQQMKQQQQVPPMSVEGLRKTAGMNYFEGYAAILPRAPPRNIIQIVLPCLYGDRQYATYGEAKKYFFIKDTDCFVFNDKTDPQPLYKISLSQPNLCAVLEDRNHPDLYSTTISPVPNTNQPRDEMITVLLKLRTNRRLVYQFTFDTTPSMTDTEKNSIDSGMFVPQQFVAMIERITNQK